jgi:hypothetical protein
MRRVTAALALVAAATAMVSGCGALDPYPTAPRGAVPGQPAGARVAICYNTMATTLAAAQAEAQQECAAGTVAEPVDTDWYIEYCPLLLPARATFVCTAKN